VFLGRRRDRIINKPLGLTVYFSKGQVSSLVSYDGFQMSLRPIDPSRSISRGEKAHRGTRALILAALLSTLLVGGCKGINMDDVTGSVPKADKAAGMDDESLRRQTEQWGKRYDSSPTDKTAAINYAHGLRLRAQYGQAVAVLQGLAIKNPKDKDVLGAYGKALADAGRLDEAAEVLQRAHSPERPNWSILSAQGSVADRMGDHASAQGYYLAALKIAPDEPSVLSNLGLSYALTRQLPQAEQSLRRASASDRADARVRQNLSLVLSLEGKYAEAEQLAQRDLSPDQAAKNVTAVRRMMAQSDTWRDLRTLDKPGAAKAVAAKPTGHTVATRQGGTPAAKSTVDPSANASLAAPK
jgi:Flp pilus assembly protein TadD